MRSIDPKTGRSKDAYSSLYCPMFYSDPSNPHMVLSAEQGLSPSGTERRDVSAYEAGGRETEFGANISGSDTAIVSDGQTFLTMSPSGVMEVRARDMQPTGMTYNNSDESDTYAIAVTDAGGGHVATGGGSDEEGVPNLYLYKRGESQPKSSMLLPDGYVLSGSLKFASGAAKIFAVTDDAYDEDDPNPTFHVLSGGPAGKRARVSLKAFHRRSTFPRKVSLKVKVRAPDNATARVKVYALGFGRWMKKVAMKRVKGDGSFTVRVRPTRHTTYFARRGPTKNTVSAVSAARKVSLKSRTHTRLRRAYKIKGRYRFYHRKKPIVQVAWVGPQQRGRALRFQAQIYRKGRWRQAYWAEHRIRRKTGVAAVAFSSDVKGKFRVRNWFDERYFIRGSRTAWRYLRVTS
jgi:hypothetical protein